MKTNKTSNYIFGVLGIIFMILTLVEIFSAVQNSLNIMLGIILSCTCISLFLVGEAYDNSPKYKR